MVKYNQNIKTKKESDTHEKTKKIVYACYNSNNNII